MMAAVNTYKAQLLSGRRLGMAMLSLTLTAAAPMLGAEIVDVDFSRDVRPLLSNKCFKCHGPDEGSREANLRLDTRQGATADLGGYRAIDIENPSASALLARIAAEDEAERMPPPDSGPKLTDHEVSLVRRWIEQQAPFEQHWAFQRIQRPLPPAVASSWPRNEIDAFILEKLGKSGIAPSPEAPRRTLIRRVYLDVLGLPPAIEDVDQFVNDASPDAYEQMVDRTLANPHYGERWGRHWLDQARYADTDGYSIDAPRTMWPYRDWVIQALNNDMPFDQFTIEQLAGDLLPDPTSGQLIATGFHRNTLINAEGGTDDEQFRNEAVVDRVNTTALVWLGLTVGCAQCHTHKFDPISHHEYYRLFAFFNSCEDVNGVAPTLRVASPEMPHRLAKGDDRTRLAEVAVEERPSQDDRIAQDGGTDGGPDATPSGREEADEKDAAPVIEAMIMRELSSPRETHVLLRGDFLRKGDRVDPDTPAVLPPLPKTGSPPTRLDLARWLVDRQNPLTARVTVNRIWARYFGQGLVETESDFGLQGAAPSHPELLDWLAMELMDQRWSLKQLHRLILTSATYRQSSDRRSDLDAVDPRNKLLARQARLRVDAEIIRDLGLAASGLLHDKIGGPSVHPPQPEGIYAFTQNPHSWPTSAGADRYRRGMYTFFVRSAPYPMLETFDVPRFAATCTVRGRSNTPLQSLVLANDETMIEVARALGQRILNHPGGNRERVDFAYQLCFARPAEPFEVDRLAAYVQQQRQGFAATPDDARNVAGLSTSQPVVKAAAWTSLARVLLNLDEFITRE